jgi:hypothetical protein
MLEAVVDESGLAVFEYPLDERHLLAWPRVRHQDMMYSAPTVHLHASPDPIQIQVQVYDVSEDNSEITVGSHHLIIRQIPKNILVTEFMQLINGTDKAITSSQKDTLNRPKVVTFFLPQGYQKFNTLEYFLQSDLVMSENSFYDSLAIPPGTYNAKFSYTLPITTEEMQISKKISMPTGDVMVFSHLKAGQLTGLGDSAGQMAMEDGSSAEYFMLATKASGDQINMTITGLETDSSKSMIIIIAVVFLLIVPLVLIRLFPSKSEKDNTDNKKCFQKTGLNIFF